MGIEPHYFLDAAEEIHGGEEVSDDETRARVSVGRAYYAAYLAAREVVRSARGDPEFTTSHGALASTLKEAADDEVAKVGEDLESLKEMRERSDYYLRKTVPSHMVALLLMQASRVVDRVPALEGRIPAHQVPARHHD